VSRHPSWHFPAGSTAEGPQAVRITPEVAGWGYAGLRVLDLSSPGSSYEGSTGEDEMVVLPLTGSAVAARTAATRTSFLSNSFMRVKHVSLFESVRLGAAAQEEDRSQDQLPIQKIMSVPVGPAGGNVIGVAQVSRKGLDASVAGADFTNEDLKLLEQAADILSRMPFMQEGADI